MYEYPFTLPPYYTAVIRCLGVLEGVALQADSTSSPTTPTVLTLLTVLTVLTTPTILTTLTTLTVFAKLTLTLSV